MTGCSPCSTLPARRRSRALALGLTASVLALGAGGHAVLKPRLYPDDFDGGGGEPVTVRIAPGATAADVASTLAGAGVVASVGSFVNVAEQRSMASWLRPGHYRLRRGMAAAAALDLLLAPGSRVVRRVTVPEGLRVEETLRRVAAQSGLPLNELRAVDPALVETAGVRRGAGGVPVSGDVRGGARGQGRGRAGRDGGAVRRHRPAATAAAAGGAGASDAAGGRHGGEHRPGRGLRGAGTIRRSLE